MAKFELVSKFADCPELLPVRSTANSAGYDLIVAESTIIPSYTDVAQFIVKPHGFKQYTLDEVKKMCLAHYFNPTLVPTGIKCALAQDEYLEIVARSSTPLKYWLIVPNAPGIIDSDYYNNPDNEGHIFVQLINLSPYDIQLVKGDKIAQAIIRKYYITEDDAASGMRTGGFGSTS